MVHTVQSAASHDARPAQLGRFHVLGRVGVGGMSEVLLAQEELQGEPLRSVALKVLRTLPSADLAEAVAARLFERETRTLLAVGHHPHVCHGYERLLLGERWVLVMEWIDGLSVRAITRLLDERGELLAPAEAAALIAQAAAGLHHAHGARRADGTPLALVHLDVNPSNLMVRYDGVLKVIDFGVARAACEAPLDVDQLLVGKFGYMAPEQLRGEPLDRRCDVFALGVCLFELLTGQRLFRADTLQELCRVVCDAELPSLGAIAPHVPAELAAITERALHKHVAARYQNAGELQAALETFLAAAHMPMGARPIARVLERLVPADARAPRLRPAATLEQLTRAAHGALSAEPLHPDDAAPHDDYTATVAVRAFPLQRRRPPALPAPAAPPAPAVLAAPSLPPAQPRVRTVTVVSLLVAAAAALALVTRGPANDSPERAPHGVSEDAIAQADAPSTSRAPSAPPSAALPGSSSTMLDALRASLEGPSAQPAPALGPSNRPRRATSEGAPTKVRRPSHGFVHDPGF